MDVYNILDFSVDDIDTFFEAKAEEVNGLFNLPIDEMDIKNDFMETFKLIGSCLSRLMTEQHLLVYLRGEKNRLKGRIFEDLKFKNGLALKKYDMDEYVYKDEKWSKISCAFEYQEGICAVLENKHKFLNSKIYILKDLREFHKTEIGMK